MAKKKPSTPIELTQEQIDLIPKWVEKFAAPVFNSHFYKNFSKNACEDLVDWQYDVAKFPRPVMLVARSPLEGQLMTNLMKNYGLCNKEMEALLEVKRSGKFERKDIPEAEEIVSKKGDLRWTQAFNRVVHEVNHQMMLKFGEIRTFKGQKTPQEIFDIIMKDPNSDAKLYQNNNNYLFTSDVYSNVLLGWWDFLVEVVKLDDPVVQDFKKWKELYLKAGIYNAIYLDGVAVITKFPKYIHRSERGRIHCSTGPSIEWECGWKVFHINGRIIPEDVFNKAFTLTRDEFVKETNSDYKGAWYEILGQKGMMDLLGAKVVDEKQIVHKNGDIEEVKLYKTKEKFAEIGNQPFAWVSMVCPSTGTQYLQGVEPHMTDALVAISSLSRLKPEEYSFGART